MTTDGDDASTLTGTTDATCSTKLITKTPPSLSMAVKVSESTRPRMYPPPAADAGIAQERDETDAAGDELVTTTEGFDTDMNRQV